ncbi:hypothetical protein Acr_00g0019770 [Actinidia rufa]|uniref:Transposase (putative) gypsy type domain-containing protein n=1 Tax=Actinidia rufa TaxID=165716 RepID=A0A7J0DCF5_9ERIC|nr:hypothetical protein Acr_00g0019770 [Actinidia rufa]
MEITRRGLSFGDVGRHHGGEIVLGARYSIINRRRLGVPSDDSSRGRDVRVSRSWGAPGKQRNKVPILSSIEEERFCQVFEKIGGGHFKISVILNSETFCKYFAPGRGKVSSSDDGTTGGEVGGEAEGDIRGESIATADHASESSHSIDVSRLGIPSREGSVELVGIIGEEMPFPHALDLDVKAIRGKESRPLRRLKLSELAKVVAQKAATLASKGVVISEGFETAFKKKALDDGSKVKQVAPLPEAKKTKTSSGVHEVPVRPPAVPREVSNLGRLFVAGSHFGIFPCHPQAIELRGALAEEKTKRKKAVEEIVAKNEVVAKLEARVAELEKSQNLANGRIITVFQELDDFLEAVRGSASSYFGDGFVFCKRQLAHQYPNLGLHLDDIEMDHDLLAQEEIEAEKRVTEDGGATEEEGTGEGEVAFYEVTFLAGLRLPIHPTIRRILNHYKICPAQLSPNAWRSVICSLARPRKNLLRGSPSNVKGWKKRFFFASENEWEFYPSMPIGNGIPRVPKKSCNKLPALTEVEAKRTTEVLGKVEPGGYFDVSKVLGSRTFNKHFAVGRMEISASGRDNITSGEEGEFRGSSREDSVEYLGAIRGDVGRIARTTFPDILDKTLLRSKSMSDSELLPKLRSDAMLARVGASIPIKKMGKKAVTEDAGKATPQLPLKGVVIQEKLPQKGDHAAKKGGLDSLKGKEAIPPPPPPKRFKSNKGAINTTLHTSMAGTSSSGNNLGSRSSMMSDASVARRLLNGAIPPTNKERAEVTELTSKLAKANELAIEEFKSSEDFKVTVTDSAATYFSEGFEFCKRRLLHQFPNLGVNVAIMEMDSGITKEEEATKEGEEGVNIRGVA